MTSVVMWIVSSILFVLSGIHVYWMIGGRLGIEAVIPSRGGEVLFRPTRIATAVVASALALSGWFVLELGGGIEQVLFPNEFYKYGGWFLAIVFLLRTVGDFRLMGFFKKEEDTLFAKLDIVLYSPLCLFIGICMIVLMTADAELYR